MYKPPFKGGVGGGHGPLLCNINTLPYLVKFHNRCSPKLGELS